MQLSGTSAGVGSTVDVPVDASRKTASAPRRRGRSEWWVVGLAVIVLVVAAVVPAFLYGPGPSRVEWFEIPFNEVLRLSGLQNPSYGEYNTTVLFLGPTLVSVQVDRLWFEIWDNESGIIQTHWVVSVYRSAGEQPPASYTLLNNVWTSGGKVQLAVGDVFVLSTGGANVTGHWWSFMALDFGYTLNLPLS